MSCDNPYVYNFHVIVVVNTGLCAAPPVFTIVCQMTSELFPGSGGNSIFSEDAYLCKQCFRAVERYVKSLQQQHKQLKDKILSADEIKSCSSIHDVSY